MKYDILVNKDHPIDENFKVDNLISIGKHYSLAKLKYTDQDVLLEKTAAKFLKELLDKANTINKNIFVIPNSGYRSYEYQIKVMDYYINLGGLEKAQKRVAKPGTSEHHTGLAIDLTFFNRGKLLNNLEDAKDTINFIYENAHNYGFILRFPKGKELITGYPYEAWHFRYVGKNLATYLYQNDLTLEEYYLENTKD